MPLIVEGKSCSTSKTVLGAQKHTVVSGACMISLQLKVSEVTKVTSLGSQRRKAPLTFSICTQEPHLEL